MNFVSKYENLLNNKLIEIVKKKSIAYRISDEIIAKSPFSVAYGMQRDDANDKLLFEKSELPLKLYQITTSLSEEFIQDLEKIFNERSVEEILLKYIENDLIYKIDKDLIDMLVASANSQSSLTLKGSDFANRIETAALAILTKITSALGKFALSDNKSALGFAIVNRDVGALINSLNAKTGGQTQDDGSPSYIGRFAGIDVYIDYTREVDSSGTDAVIFGTKGDGVTQGSVQLQRYPEVTSLRVMNPASGEPTISYFYRVGMCINPLDKIYTNNGSDSQFVGKFDCDLSQMIPFNS